MSMRNVSIMAAAGAALAVAGQAQQEDEAGAPREAAELPPRLEETGERAPQTVPRSSAEDAGDTGAIAPGAVRFGLGRPATGDEIAAVDIDVMPDGRGAPEGSGTFAEGKELYATHCVACHGEDLQGVEGTGGVALIGGRGTLDTDEPVKTVESYWPHASTLFDYTRRAMPFSDPGSLTADEVYAISAYILGRAGIIEEGTEMNAATFAEIEMPNADGFYRADRPDTGPEQDSETD
ncbi:MAG: c-type cytochrome [Roseicyclus sp.]